MDGRQARAFEFMMFALVLALVPDVEGQTVSGGKPLSEPALAETTWIEEFDLSPDGSQLVFKSARGGNYNLWKVGIGGGEPERLTSFRPPMRAKNPRWSPDGNWIAFQVDRHTRYSSERDDVYVIAASESEIAASGGEPRNLTDTDWSSEVSITWSPDSRYLAFSSSALLGGGILRAEVSTGELGRISATGGGDLQWSPEGGRIAYSANRVRDESFVSNGDLYVVSVANGEERMLTPDILGFRERDPHWSPDGRRVAFVTDRTGHDNVAFVDVDSGETHLLTETAHDHANPSWAPDGRSIAYVVNVDYNYYIETVPVGGGTPVRVTERPGVNGGMERIQVRGTFRWLPQGDGIAYTHMSPSDTSDLWVINAGGGEPQRITESRHPSLRDEDLFVWPELMRYASFDGMEVQGFLYKPQGVEDGDRAPFVMFYRSNSTGQHPVGWQPYVQYYVSKGYVVFAPNFRGSTGQGKAYAEANHTHGGDRDIRDAMMAVDILGSRKLIDRNRMGMVGGSTGGFFVMATLIQRPRDFRAAVNFYGVTDLVTLADVCRAWHAN